MTREADAREQVLLRLVMYELADVVGHVHRVGPRRLVAPVAPRLVGFSRLRVRSLEVEALGRRLVAEALALKVRGDREDLEPVFLGQINAPFGVSGRALVGIALAQVEFPGCLFPAVEAGVLEELDPLAEIHVAELSANEADLVVGRLAEPVFGGLLEAHWRGPLGCGMRVVRLSLHAARARASTKGYGVKQRCARRGSRASSRTWSVASAGGSSRSAA